MSGERGLVLPLALAAMAVGTLFVAPFLGYASTTLMSSQQYGTETKGQYSADAGVEHALWRLLHESEFAESMTSDDPSVEYSINVNDTDVSINVTQIAGLKSDALSLDNLDYTVPAGNQLEFRIVVLDDDHCNFAYDTEGYDSWIQVPTSETFTYHLHNNPTPPEGDTDGQANLPMDETGPTASTLYNYDQNYDSAPGRRIEESNGVLEELELKEYQNWRTSEYASDTHIDGSVKINLYVAPDGFNYDNDGSFTAYLFDYNPDYDPESDEYEYYEISSETYTITEDQWVEDEWYSTVPEGKYEIVATAGNTEISAVAVLSFDGLSVLSFEYLHGG